MPLAVRDYTWEETEKMLFLTVPLKGVKANKVDILSSEDYIKVHMWMFNIIMIMIFFGPCVIFGDEVDPNYHQNRCVLVNIIMMRRSREIFPWMVGGGLFYREGVSVM